MDLAPQSLAPQKRELDIPLNQDSLIQREAEPLVAMQDILGQ